MQPRRLIAVAGLVAAIPFGAGVPAGATSPAAAGSDRPAAVGAKPVVTGLNFPAAFTVAPDGRFFYGERLTGQIRIFDPATKSNKLFYQVTNLSTQGEQGLLGLALDPGYPGTPLVYAYATRDDNGLKNEILKLQDKGGTGSLVKVIWKSDTVAGQYHDGGRILFGPDGKLYAVVGEGHDSSNSQDLTNDAGKILRMTRRGKAPAGNPFAGSRIWTYGHRNSYGFTFDPLKGYLWETENGPECNDEINFVGKMKGANFGWGPHETCQAPPDPPLNTNQDGPNPVLPLIWFTPTIAPTGAAFCVTCGLTGSDGDLFFGGYNDHKIQRAVLTRDRTGIKSYAVVYSHGAGVLSLERGPGGTLYFSSVDGGIYELVNA